MVPVRFHRPFQLVGECSLHPGHLKSPCVKGERLSNIIPLQCIVCNIETNLCLCI